VQRTSLSSITVKFITFAPTAPRDIRQLIGLYQLVVFVLSPTKHARMVQMPFVGKKFNKTSSCIPIRRRLQKLSPAPDLGVRLYFLSNPTLALHIYIRPFFTWELFFKKEKGYHGLDLFTWKMLLSLPIFAHILHG
jgi:hypothetical protein